MGNNIPKNHHFVPQWLLRRFTTADGALYVYDTEKQRKWGVANTESAGSENDFHTIKLKGGVKDRSTIENWITEHVDTPGADSTAGLLNRESLTHRRALSFMRFVSAQIHRTPTSLRQISDLITPVMQESIKRMATYDQGFRSSVSARLIAGGTSAEIIEQMLAAAASGEMVGSPSRDYVLLLALNQVVPTAKVLCQMHWQYLSVPHGDDDLIIGDHPVTLTNSGSDDGPPSPLGIQNPNIEIAVPLSRRMVAIARWTGEAGYGTLLSGMSKLINERMMRWANRFVYASADSDALLENAVMLRRSGPKVHVQRVELDGKLAIVQTHY